MLIIKRFIVWTILFAITLTQFLLYLPDFSCTLSTSLPTCTAQFNFAIVDSSRITHDFIASVQEFLKLLSYLTIDMGWSNELSDPSIYNDENLVDTFHQENIYKMNYFGYCKRTNGKRVYCVQNGNSGMDVLSLLIRDIGIQLGKLSSIHAGNTKVLADSLAFTYQLALSSLHSFLKNDRSRENAFSNIIVGSLHDESVSSNYSKGVTIAYALMIFNKILLFIHISEICMSFVCLLSVVIFGMSLIWGKKHYALPILLKSTSFILITASSITIISNILYLMGLKMLEPSKINGVSTGWELLQVTVGSGFIIGCTRYLVQCIFVPVTFLTANHYSVKNSSKKTEEVIIEDDDSLKEIS